MRKGGMRESADWGARVSPQKVAPNIKAHTRFTFSSDSGAKQKSSGFGTISRCG